MKLILKSHKLPALYATDKQGDNAVARVKWFDPCGSFTWYVLEYNEEENVVFAFVTSSMCPEGEYGYTSVAEVESVKNRMGLHMERDLHWQPKTMRERRASL